jgi:hypothetical protein
VPGIARAVSGTYDALAMAGEADEFKAIIDEARAAIADGRQPDARALEARIRSAAKRQQSDPSRPLKQLERVLSIHRARDALARQPAPPPASPSRRPAIRTRPTITGNMEVRRKKEGESFGLAWDAASGVAEWEVRISERPDARRDYAVRDTLKLAANETSLELPLGDRSVRVHVLGRSRGGKLVRRAVISALTRDSWDERWQRRASAS